MRLINASFQGACGGCGAVIPANVQCWWAQGQPLRCVDCGPDFAGEDRRGAATEAEDVPGYVAQLKKQIEKLEGVQANTEDTLHRLHLRLEAIEAWTRRISFELGVGPPAPLEG